MAKAKKVVEWAGDTENCGYCAETKKFLKDEGIRSKYYHMDTPKGSALLDKAGADAIPAFKVCDVTPSGQKRNCNFIVGFDKGELNAALGK